MCCLCLHNNNHNCYRVIKEQSLKFGKNQPKQSALNWPFTKVHYNSKNYSIPIACVASFAWQEWTISTIFIDSRSQWEELDVAISLVYNMEAPVIIRDRVL